MKEKKIFFKFIVLYIYKKIINILFFQRVFFKKKLNKEIINIFFGGAYSGSKGGTLVKVKRLKQYFKEDRLNFNIVYLLSNSIYYDFKYLQKIKNIIPIIHNQNGVFYTSWYAGDCNIENKKMSKQLHISDYVLFQSKFCKLSSDTYLGVREKNFEIVYNAVDLKKFSPSKINFEINDIKILMTGTFRPYMIKGVESAINAIAILKKKYQICLTIAGFVDNFSKNYLEKLIIKNKLENNINFTGTYDQEVAEKIYRANDIYFFFVQNPPCPNALIEAIACGLPAIYSDSGSAKEIVEKGGIGVTCPLSWEEFYFLDENEIAKSTEQIINNYSYFSKQARISAMNKHDINSWILKHQQIFKNYL
jgi:glycosyltransferase involved in cell wall biosynthesis